MTGHTNQRLEEFRKQFAARRSRRFLVNAGILALILVFATKDEQSGMVLGGIPMLVFLPFALVGLAGAIWYTLRDWRCPACRQFLGPGINPRSCEKCGLVLRS